MGHRHGGYHPSAKAGNGELGYQLLTGAGGGASAAELVGAEARARAGSVGEVMAIVEQKFRTDAGVRTERVQPWLVTILGMQGTQPAVMMVAA